MMQSIRHSWSQFLSFLFPPLCLSCSKHVQTWGEFCVSCWSDLVFISDPLCTQCGSPFDFDVEEEILCGKCITRPPFYDKVRSIFLYNDISKKIVLRLKHHDGTHLGRYMAKYMENVQDLLNVDIITPVPLHWTRLLFRKFNQSALLMSYLPKTEAQKINDLLLRTKKTTIQGVLNEKDRIKNVSRAFKINPKYMSHIKGKTILLIDDVFTTRSTVNECAKVLKKKGAKAVYCLSFARTKMK